MHPTSAANEQVLIVCCAQGRDTAGLPMELRGTCASRERELCSSLLPSADCAPVLSLSGLCGIEQKRAGDYSLLEPKLAEQDRAAAPLIQSPANSTA